MPTVCVIGASSFLGQQCLNRIAADRKVALRVLIHRSLPASFENRDGVALIQGDVREPQSLCKLITRGSIVLNLAYLHQADKQENLDGAEAILRACEISGANRLVHCSTAAVSGRGGGRVIDESIPCAPLSEYERTKYEIEQLFLNRRTAKGNCQVVILRPTAVFGPGGKNLVSLADRLMSGASLPNYLRSCFQGGRRMNAVCVDNVAACFAYLALTDADVDGQTFIISDDESPNNNYRYIEKVFLGVFGRGDYAIPRVPVPEKLLSHVLKGLGRSNVDPSRTYSCEKVLELGYRKPVSFEQGLIKFAEWYKESSMNKAL